jgi:hypothetical protein
MNRVLMLALLVTYLDQRANERYGAMWRYMHRAYLRRAPDMDAVLLMHLALLGCEQVLKMAQTVSWEEE